MKHEQHMTCERDAFKILNLKTYFQIYMFLAKLVCTRTVEYPHVRSLLFKKLNLLLFSMFYFESIFGIGFHSPKLSANIWLARLYSYEYSMKFNDGAVLVLPTFKRTKNILTTAKLSSSTIFISIFLLFLFMSHKKERITQTIIDERSVNRPILELKKVYK